MMFGLVPLSDSVSAARDMDEQTERKAMVNKAERMNLTWFERIKTNSLTIEGDEWGKACVERDLGRSISLSQYS